MRELSVCEVQEVNGGIAKLLDSTVLGRAGALGFIFDFMEGFAKEIEGIE